VTASSDNLQKGHISLAIDAGTIERLHFLDVTILEPQSRLAAFLHDALEKEPLTSEDSRNLIATMVQELTMKGV
jgi:hypothetical protein